MTQNQRLFIGGLKEDFSEKSLIKNILNFGQIISLEKKTKKDQLDNVKTFVFVNINASLGDIHSCIGKFNGSTWKGMVLTIQIAKESHLEKLRREREEAKKDQEKLQEAEQEKLLEVPKSPKKAKKIIKAPVESSSDSDSESTDDDEDKSLENKKLNEYQTGNNQSTCRTNNIQIQKKPLENKQKSNQKRLEALSSHQDKLKEQKKLIKEAITKGSVQGKRTVFNYSNEETTVPKNSLFDDDEDPFNQLDFENMFQEKPHFNSVKGLELMEKTLGFDDARFQMDSEYIEEAHSKSEKDFTYNREDKNRWKHTKFEINQFKRVQKFDPQDKKKQDNVPIIPKVVPCAIVNKDYLTADTTTFSFASLFQQQEPKEELLDEVLLKDWNPFIKEAKVHKESVGSAKEPTRKKFSLFGNIGGNDKDDETIIKHEVNKYEVCQALKRKKFSNDQQFQKKQFKKARA